MSQESIIDEVRFERKCQDHLWGPVIDDRHQANDWIAIAVRHLGLAANDGGADDVARFRKQMIRLAALAIASVEAFDREHGGKAWFHSEGSGY